MARKLYYKILDDGKNRLSDGEWSDIQRLQHWYNSEFIWTAGKLNFRNYVIFPNVDLGDEECDKLWTLIRERKRALSSLGFSEQDVIEKLKAEGLIIVQRGGYYDHCRASGFTRVASNEWNAYLVCEFLLKASRIAPESAIDIFDEGSFVKSKSIRVTNGTVTVLLTDERTRSYVTAMVEHQHVFAVVDPTKYDGFPTYRSTVPNFNDLERKEQRGILKK